MYVKKKGLPQKEVARLIVDTLDYFGLPQLTHDQMHAIFHDTIPMPVIVQNKEVEVWCDKYYIAYSFRDEMTVHYVYITYRHLREESNQRRNPIVAGAFREAREQMNGSEKNYCIFRLCQ